MMLSPHAATVLDQATLSELASAVGGDLTELRSIFEDFLSDAHSRAASLSATCGIDCESCRRTAHALRGSAASVGALALSRSAEALEQEAAAGHALPETIDGVQRELRRLAALAAELFASPVRAAVETQR